MGLSFTKGYVFKTYSVNKSGHNHSSHQMKMEKTNEHRTFKNLIDYGVIALLVFLWVLSLFGFYRKNTFYKS